MQLSLLSGFYQARSVIAAAQRCLNLYPEVNQSNTFQGLPESDAAARVTLYPTPGTRLLASLPVAQQAAGRGLYLASNGTLYAVVNDAVYMVSPQWQFTVLGYIQRGTTPVSMADNAVTLVLVDGSPNGYLIDLATNVFSTLIDSTGSFQGSDRVEYLDGFFIFNKPGFPQFYCSLAQSVTFDPLYFANKNGASDNLVTLIVNQRNIWLLGAQTAEIWSDVGAAAFPFAINPANFIQHGCAAKYSVCKHDTNIFWLGQDPQGSRIVFTAGEDYLAERISTHAIENEFAGYGIVNDAIGFTYQELGHSFYVLTFPSADRTWVYDTETALWHERGTIDGSGQQHRIRANAYAYAYGEAVTIDFANGSLMAIDSDTYTDLGEPIVRECTYPHTLNEMKRIVYHKFIADMETGNSTVPDNAAGGQPLVSLSWSNDRGFSYETPITKTLGTQGNRMATVTWWRLGLARDRIFRLRWSSPSRTALNGAFVDVAPSSS